MSDRKIGIPVVAAYLALVWGAVGAGLVFVTSNTAPQAPKISFAEENPNTTTSVEVVVDHEATRPDPKDPEAEGTAVDADGDPIKYVATWTKNGEPVEDLNVLRVNKTDTMKGDVWEVTVLADDGTSDTWGCSLPWRECAAATTTLSFTVGNAPPRARIRFVNKDGEEVEDASPREDLMLDMSCGDPDVRDQERLARELAAKEAAENPAQAEAPAEETATDAAEEEEVEEVDPCTYTIKWYKGDDEITEESELLGEGDVLSRRKLPRDTRLTVVAVANDGEDDGNEATEVIYVMAR